VLAGPLLGRYSLRKATRGAIAVRGGEWAELVGELSKALGLRRRVTLLLSDGQVMPMTWGWLRPVVLLPAEAGRWEPGRRRDVLFHELAHVRRWDCLTQAVAQLACGVYWFNPLAWLAQARMRAERERACDDLVLASGVRASDYAAHLLQMARELRFGRASALAAVAMARPSQLEVRLLSILDPHRRRGGPGPAATALAVAAVAALVLPLAAARLEARAAGDEGAEKPVIFEISKERGTMTVRGRVLDPDGRPVEGAAVDLVGRRIGTWVGASRDEEDRVEVFGRAETDEGGRFRLESTRPASQHVRDVQLLAAAPGFGLGWAELNADAERPEAEVRLHPEGAVRVTFVDVTGMPARGVAVTVKGFGRPKGPADDEGVYLGPSPPESLRAWPRAATTDDQGSFRLAGIGRDFTATLDVRDLRFARQTPEVKTSDPEAVLALEPARIIEGRVVAADTGAPLPHAVISAAARIQNEHANGYFFTKFLADADGRFRINPLSSDEYQLHAYPPAGAPYLVAHGELKWVKGAVRTAHDFRLRRGVLIRGKVTEDGSGRPLPGSTVQFMPIGRDDEVLSGWQAIVSSGDDGIYRIAVPPGRGHLLIFGPTSNYVQETTGERMLYSGKPGGRRYYAHKVIAYDVPPAVGAVALDAPLRPGKTVTLHVSGPAGQTVRDALYLTTLHAIAINPSGGVCTGTGSRTADSSCTGSPRGRPPGWTSSTTSTAGAPPSRSRPTGPATRCP
jgi:protocatechuate 3,4-dioxygenase beta subunit